MQVHHPFLIINVSNYNLNLVYILMWIWWSDVDMVDAVDDLVGYMCCVVANMCGGFVWMEICVVVLCVWKYVWCFFMETCVVVLCGWEYVWCFFCGWKYVWCLDSSNGCNAEEQLSRRSNLRRSDNMLHKSYLFSFIF